MFLCYCVVESEADVRAPGRGVAGAEVRELHADGVRCFYSPWEPQKMPTEAALEFQRLISSVFAQAQTVPFRFGHPVATEEDLRSFIAQHAAAYRRALQYFRGLAQMDAALTFTPPAGETTSGREYLDRIRERRAALREAVTALRRGVCARAWKESEQQEKLRCYALIELDAAAEFRDQMLRVNLPKTLRALVSGPWPPAEFMKLNEAPLAAVEAVRLEEGPR
ncbi:MAG TPA: GvpL/GvpF family gas vesicle protein [Terriglobales bacterium]|nr:GvpL/GvpF family gas vesicle protein [Terriglobales bacterium]